MFNPNQRRYLGNKNSLLDFIEESLKKNGIEYKSFVDLFAGTGSVGFFEAAKGKDVKFNDFLYSNYVVYQGFVGPGKYDLNKLDKIITLWNKKNVTAQNYFSENFGGKYFSLLDSKKIGKFRDEIEKMKNEKSITLKEYYILISSLIYSIDKIALTVGHYDAYRINADKKETLKLDLIKPIDPEGNIELFNSDSNIIARDLNDDLVYIDPPYNSRQYGDAYHLLENLAKWDKPETFGKASKMDRNDIKSEYSKKNAIIYFETLINSINSKYIVVSYNDTGLFGSGRSQAKMSDKDIKRILENRGEVIVEKKEYNAFNTGKTERKIVYERLFICKVIKEPTYKQNLKSPLNYMGGKFGIIDQLKKMFPENIDNFYDIFAGALNVGINSESKKVYSIEKKKELVDVLNYIKNNETSEIINSIEKNIKKYNLSNTSKYTYLKYETNSSDGLAKHNKKPYIKMREDYNQSKKVELLLMLLIYGFNNLLRLNSIEEFNTPVGKRDFNSKIRANLISFSERLKDIVIEIKNDTFMNIEINKIKKDDFVFVDPPYLITNAVYNNKDWTEEDESNLYEFLTKLNDKGIRFMLTNAIEANDRINIQLKDFIKKNKLKTRVTKNNFKNSSYNKKPTTGTKELIITNY